ncbi:MAG: radical SAM protein [Planctomycetota bacterium]
MRIDIVVVYEQRYRVGHEKHFVPPITGIHLAALTPDHHEPRVVHQQIRPVELDTDAELVALSFFSGFATEAYRLADAFRARGKLVVAGGPHATYWPDEALRHCDTVVVGEAEDVWSSLLDDAEQGRLRRIYRSSPPSLADVPTPRYDLLPSTFFVPRVVQATRGCPYACSFCTVPSLNPGFRTRPVARVLADIDYDDFPHWWQRRVVWFWDDNLTAKRPFVKQLLREMIPRKRWWLTQASMDIARDRELLDLMERSGCIGIFFGIETFGSLSLVDANKPQNKIQRYRECIERLHERGICVMAGFVAGFDGDDPASIVGMADRLQEIEIDVPFLSVLTPYKGTALYDKLRGEGRLLGERSWEFYNGYNVTFQPKGMGSEELLDAHRELWRRAFSPARAAARIARGARKLRAGAALMSACMNGFYGLKGLRGNEPLDVRSRVATPVVEVPAHITTPPIGRPAQSIRAGL